MHHGPLQSMVHICLMPLITFWLCLAGCQWQDAGPWYKDNTKVSCTTLNPDTTKPGEAVCIDVDFFAPNGEAGPCIGGALMVLPYDLHVSYDHTWLQASAIWSCFVTCDIPRLPFRSTVVSWKQPKFLQPLSLELCYEHRDLGCLFGHNDASHAVSQEFKAADNHSSDGLCPQFCLVLL